MITGYGTWEVRYCVAQVNLFGGKAEVSYYAYSNDVYGLHRVGDIHDPNVVWYDTEEEAKRAIFNSNDCVLSLGRDVKAPFIGK